MSIRIKCEAPESFKDVWWPGRTAVAPRVGDLVRGHRSTMADPPAPGDAPTFELRVAAVVHTNATFHDDPVVVLKLSE